MKRKLLGYTVQFSFNRFDPGDGIMRLGIDEGQKLTNLLSRKTVPMFVTIASRDETIKVATIERIQPIYQDLEEKCLVCYKLKQKGKDCPRGCDKWMSQDNPLKPMGTLKGGY